MKEHPILMCTECVNLLRSGKKTQTRRPVWNKCKSYQVGDRLWVRETFHKSLDGNILYLAGNENRKDVRWRPSMFLSRKDARIILKITDVRTQTLFEMTDAEAQAEGVESVHEYKKLWNSIYRKSGPEFIGKLEVIVIEFKLVEDLK